VTIRIALGSVGVSAGWLSEWSQGWARGLGVEVEVVDAAGEDAQLAALDAPDGVLAAPGELTPSLAAALVAASRRAVLVDLEEAVGPAPAPPQVAAVRGRGLDGFRWAAQWLLQRQEHPFEPRPYGELPDQFADLRLPAGGEPPHPVAVLLHGGFWRERWLRDTIEPLAIDLARRGYATWNVEYRRVGPSGGGWPATCADVAAAVDALAGLDVPLDLARVVVVGHSAGGQLAAWLAHRRGVDGTAVVRPAVVVSLAGVLDLVGGARRGLGDTGNPVASFVGGRPEEVPERYEAASPLALLPLGLPQVVVQGTDDSPDFVDLHRGYVAAARAAGDPIVELEPAGADHFTVITPSSDVWSATVDGFEPLLR
jgi:acetyl esterase/lipase